MDGEIEVDRQMDRCWTWQQKIDGQKDRLLDRQFDGQIDKIDWYVYKQIDKYENRQVDRQMIISTQ